MERKKKHILQGPEILDHRVTGWASIQRDSISVQPMVPFLVFFDNIFSRQDSPFLQKNDPEIGLRTPASGVVYNFGTYEFQKEQAGNFYISFRVLVNVFVQLIICGCI